MSGKSYKEQNKDRRDLRQTKSEIVDQPHNKRKNCKKWCRGKVGVEHITECKKYSEVKNVSEHAYSKYWRILVCTICGKEIDMHYSFGNKNKPKWVDK